MAPIRYPIGIQDFEKLRSLNALYVDKTMYIRRLVETGTIYFLGRPRRFGKSLLLSTLHAFFEGKRNLFKGLEIDSWDEWDWEEYPVIHLDLNAKNYTYKESLEEKINAQLSYYEAKYNVASPDNSLDGRFASLISNAYHSTGKGVVVLIDEYDKPILDTMHDDSLKDLHRDTLRAFYSTLKSSDRYLRFCFLTGVTKFGQLNIFSGLNNLEDISLWNQYADICGISEDDLHKYFDCSVAQCAEDWNCSKEEAYSVLKKNYDGYHFSPSLLDVYNPWSVLNAIKSKIIDFYWNATGGGSSYIFRLLESRKVALSNLDNVRVSIEMLKGTNVEIRDAVPLLYQSGYLTIKSFDFATSSAVLKYPNFEVERGFFTGLLPAYAGVDSSESGFAIADFVNDVCSGDVDNMMERMQAFFEDFPYENAIKTERQFQNIMYCIMRMMGLQVQLERHSSRGSADMTIFTPDHIYIFEFKVDKSPEEALKQIEDKGYALPYAKDSRPLIKVGVEFSLSAHNITAWQIADE